MLVELNSSFARRNKSSTRPARVDLLSLNATVFSSIIHAITVDDCGDRGN